jgi:hypothetical protein
VKSISQLAGRSAALPILADELVEFHAARLILLFRLCGTANRMVGLTKMAKLDFFVRYPKFFDEVAANLQSATRSVLHSAESSMVRFHYGPWDHRYYHVLAYLEAKNLITVEKEGTAFVFLLTALGEDIAKQLSRRQEYESLCIQMQLVKKVLGRFSGSGLKKLVYDTFDKEIASKSIGQVIE